MDKTIYDGDFENDHMCGYGTLTWPDRTRYEGYFTNDLRDGYGKMISPEDNDYDEGIWSEDKFVGEINILPKKN